LKIPRYRTLGENTLSPVASFLKRTAAGRPRLLRRQPRAIHDHAHLRPNRSSRDCDAVSFGHAFAQRGAGGKHTAFQTNFVAGRETGMRFDHNIALSSSPARMLLSTSPEAMLDLCPLPISRSTPRVERMECQRLMRHIEATKK